MGEPIFHFLFIFPFGSTIHSVLFNRPNRRRHIDPSTISLPILSPFITLFACFYQDVKLCTTTRSSTDKQSQLGCLPNGTDRKVPRAPRPLIPVPLKGCIQPISQPLLSAMTAQPCYRQTQTQTVGDEITPTNKPIRYWIMCRAHILSLSVVGQFATMLFQ